MTTGNEVYDPAAPRIHMGRARRAQQRGSRRLLMRGLPPPRCHGRTRRAIVPDNSAGSHNSAHAALVIDEDGSAQGWCQHGKPRRTSRHQAQARLRQGRSATSTPADHLLPHRQEAPRSGHRVRRRKACSTRSPILAAGLSGEFRGDRRPPGAGPLPVQRDSRTCRAERLHPRPAGRQARLDRKQSDPAGQSIGTQSAAHRCRSSALIC
jgi:hypothetical protein